MFARQVEYSVDEFVVIYGEFGTSLGFSKSVR